MTGSGPVPFCCSITSEQDRPSQHCPMGTWIQALIRRKKNLWWHSKCFSLNGKRPQGRIPPTCGPVSMHQAFGRGQGCCGAQYCSSDTQQGFFETHKLHGLRVQVGGVFHLGTPAMALLISLILQSQYEEPWQPSAFPSLNVGRWLPVQTRLKFYLRAPSSCLKGLHSLLHIEL